jgi:hypothetical protein
MSTLNNDIAQQLGPRDTDFVNQYIGAGSKFDDVLVITGVAGDHHRVALVFER